ncbi:MAG: hypothetical protein ACREDQ_13680 [Limisphaerales bacterium]
MKIVCDCGQKYKFDVEPVNGRMPMTVNCPVCGTDGTAAANGILAQTFSNPAQPIPATPTVQPAGVPPPAIVTPAPPAGGLRINRPAPAPAVVNPPPLPATPRPITAMRSPGLAAASKPKATGEYSLGLGILGAVLGAALGAGLMYAFFLWADFRFPLMGTCVGALTGLGARLLAKGTDTTLGAIAGGIALVSTAGTLYLMFGDVAGMFILSMIVSVGFAYKIAG